MPDNNLTEQIAQEVRKIMSDFIPVGTIQCFSMENTASLGLWMPCDGRPLDVFEYPELFHKIGLTYGGDGHYFKIPDLRGRFIRGWDEDGLHDPGRNFGSYQEDSLQDHSHSVDESKFSTDYSGEHFHSIDYSEGEVVSAGIDINPLTVLTKSTLNVAISRWHGDETSNAGYHHHNLEIENDAVQQCASILSGGEVRTAMETRPKNVAMHFCIRVK